MSRLDLQMAFNYVFPQTPNGICRYCRKPIPKGSKRSAWCGDGCKHAADTMLSWDSARMATAKRDDYKCQMCGTPIYLFKPFNIEGYTIEDKIKYSDYFRCCQGEKQAEIHHIIPVGELCETAWEVTREINDEKEREYWFWKLGVMLQLDINNLTTLCQKPCHDEAHNHLNNLMRKNRKEHKLLDEFRGDLV